MENIDSQPMQTDAASTHGVYIVRNFVVKY